MLILCRINDPVALKLLNKAGEMPSLEPPEDEGIKTLYVGGVDPRVTEQDLRDNFYAHGEIESVKMVLPKGCAFVTYTTREGAEKAAQELSNKLVIKGLRLKLMWGRPQAPRPDPDGSETARAVAHSGLLPRAVVSQQQSHQNAPMQQYYSFPPPPQQPGRNYYPSMDPQRMGALVQEGSSSSTENENLPGQHYPHPPPPHGNYYPPPYGFMPPPPMPYQQYQGHVMPHMAPPSQHYQHSSAPNVSVSGASSVPGTAQQSGAGSESSAPQVTSQE